MSNKLVIPMSSSGHCPRALTAELLGKESKDKPSWLEPSAREGRVHEKILKDDLREKGYIIEESIGECLICKERFGSGREGIHVEIEEKEFLLIGHLDGKCKLKQDNPWMKLECKSMSQNEFYRWMKGGFDEFPHYADQLTCYGQATKIRESVYIVKNRNLGQKDEQILTEDPHDWNELRSRLLFVVDCVSKGILPEVTYNPDNIYCKRCLFTSLCLPDPKEYSPATVEMLKDALDKKQKSLDLAKEAGALKYEAETVIKNHLKAIGQNKLKFAGWAISMTPNRTTTTYPKENLLKLLTQEQLDSIANVSEPWDGLWMKNLNSED